MKRAIRRQLRIWYADITGYLSKLKTFHRTALGIIIAIVIIYAARKYWLDPIRAEIFELESNYEKSEPPNPLPTIESDEEITLAKEQIESRSKNAESKKREMETVAKSRAKITQQNKESVLSEFASIISKNKLIVVLGGAPEPDNSTPSNSPRSTPTRPASRPTITRVSAEISKTPTKQSPTKQQKTTTKKNTKPTDKKSESETKSTPQNVEKPLKTEHYLYYLEGDFNNIFDFLKQVESFPYPIKITKLFFGTEEPNTETTTINKQTFNNREKLQLKFHLTLYFH